MSQFASFWEGPALSAFEASCLHSFVVAGHEMTLFSYEPVANVPVGVRLADAAQIASRSGLSRFRVDGRPSVSHFSDYFRYLLFSRTPLTWVDTDVLLLRSWQQDPDRNLLALEAPGSICNAVLRISAKERWLPELIASAEALMDTNMRHGETGPRLITRLVGDNEELKMQPEALYFPVHFDSFWKVFLPEHADECREACAAARTLHLWNNIVELLGFWKEFLPPGGSYLHDAFVERGCESYFRGEFPLRNMRQLVDNWRSRQTGQHLGVRGVVRQLLPSVIRTYRHYKG